MGAKKKQTQTVIATGFKERQPLNGNLSANSKTYVLILRGLRAVLCAPEKAGNIVFHLLNRTSHSIF